MKFTEIYDTLDSKIKQYINDNNLHNVEKSTITSATALLLKNQFTFNEGKSTNFYCVYHDLPKIINDIFPFDSKSVSRLEQFLKNLGHFFINESNDSLALEKFNNLKDISLIFIGKNYWEKDFFAISFHKYNIFVRLTAEHILFSAGHTLTTELPLSDDIDVDFNLALDDFSNKIAQSTGFLVDSNFKENIDKTTISERINNVFAQQNIQDIVYVDKSDILTSMIPYKETSNFKVGVDDFSFSKEDHKTMFALLNKVFFNDCYDTLTKIITVVINYQKAMHREGNLNISFPVNSRFYDTAKLPVIKIYLNEKYQLGFSTNGYIFKNNSVPQYVNDYKRLPEVLNKILEESERHFDREKLTKQLI